MHATFSRNTLFTKLAFSLVGNDEGQPIWKEVDKQVRKKKKAVRIFDNCVGR